MNLLQAQDALKNASDQQLMALMQSPDSTAPSYLVLSEIRRRKDMRAKQAPEGAPNRTVAEELTAPQAPVGIQALQGMAPQGSMDPDGVDAAEGGVQGMAAGGLASLRRYQEGGVVRMEGGGQPPTPPPPTPPPSTPSRPLSQMSPSEVRAYITGQFPGYGERLDRFDYEANEGLPQPPGYTAQEALLELYRRGLNPTTLRPYPSNAGIFSSGDNAEEFGNFTPAPPASVGRPSTAATPTEDADPYSGVFPLGEDVLGAPLNQQPQPSPAPPAPAGFAGSIPGVGAAVAPVVSGSALPPAAGQRPAPSAAGQRPAPSAGGQRPTAGIATLAPAAAHNESQVPSFADLMRRNAELFPDNMSGIRSQMREDRVDPAARRNEAVNMALIEAGLRIAGSRNPSLIGAIGEGALPAVQSYGQQLGQIRGEQRQSRQDELELAKQEVTRQFAIGQISAAEYRTRMDNINANARIAAQERGADRRAGASEAAADRRLERERILRTEQAHREGLYTPQEFAELSLEQQAHVREMRPTRPLDTANVASSLNRENAQIISLREELGSLREAPSQTTLFGSPNPEFARWTARKADLEARLRTSTARASELDNILIYGRPRPGAGGATTGRNAADASDPFGLR